MATTQGKESSLQRTVKQLLNFSLFRRLPMIRQDSAAECGLACLAMIAAYHGHDIELFELRRRFAISQRGTTVKTMVQEIAPKMELSGRVVRCTPKELSALTTPYIMHWGMNHFVVVKKLWANSILVHDPGAGVLRVSKKELLEKFTGVVIQLTPTEKFKQKSAIPKLKLFELVVFNKQFFKTFSMGLILSILIRLFLLATPFYMQIVIDEVLLKGDTPLLNDLLVAVIVLAIFKTVAGTLRDLTFQFLSHTLSFDMTARIFNKLLRLPMSYFYSRHLGDVQQRVQSLQQIQSFLTAGAPTALLDGMFSFLVLAIMFYYSATLTWAILACMLLLVLWKVAIFRVMLAAAAGLIVAETREQTHLLETIRGMLSIKASALQNRREEVWQNRFSKKLDASIRVGNVYVIDSAVRSTITGILYAVIVFMVANDVLAGTMTIGMITAFMAYRSQFESSILALIDIAVEYRLLQVPLGRVTDIVMTVADKEGEDGGRNLDLQGALTVQNISFTYGANDAPVLQGVSLIVNVGDQVVICGRSGGGKSTLLQITLGLLTPRSGTIQYDARSLDKWNRQTLLNQIGTVLQKDKLFQGTLADNIGNYASQIDMQQIRRTARLACIDQEIENFPMGYETLVGDMGAALSAGQNQRLLIARALYNNPKMLVLDEATSELDADTEQQLYTNLLQMDITILATAHRPDTIARFPRVMTLEQGVLRETGRNPP